MFHVIDDARISGYRPLISPAILIEEIPVSEPASKLIANARSATEAIIGGEDDRLLVVAGPCSIHDTQAALEYADHLHGALDDLKADLCIVMRVYFEKPRTTIGWKGLINDPHLDGTFDINNGLRAAAAARGGASIILPTSTIAQAACPDRQSDRSSRTNSAASRPPAGR